MRKDAVIAERAAFRLIEMLTGGQFDALGLGWRLQAAAAGGIGFYKTSFQFERAQKTASQ